MALPHGIDAPQRLQRTMPGRFAVDLFVYCVVQQKIRLTCPAQPSCIFFHQIFLNINYEYPVVNLT